MVILIGVFTLFSFFVEASGRMPCADTLIAVYQFDPIETGIAARLSSKQARGLFRCHETRIEFLHLVRVWNWLEKGGEGIEELARLISDVSDQSDWQDSRIDDWKRAEDISDNLTLAMKAVLKSRADKPVTSRELTVKELQMRIDSWVKSLGENDRDLLIHWGMRKGFINIDLSSVPLRYKPTAERDFLKSRDFRNKVIGGGVFASHLTIHFMHALKAPYIVQNRSPMKIAFRMDSILRTESFSATSSNLKRFFQSCGAIANDEIILQKAWMNVAVEPDPTLTPRELKELLFRMIISRLRQLELEYRDQLETPVESEKSGTPPLTTGNNHTKGPVSVRPIRKSEPDDTEKPDQLPGHLVAEDYRAMTLAMSEHGREKLFRDLAASSHIFDRFIREWREIEEQTEREEFQRIQNSIINGLLILTHDRRATTLLGRHLRFVGKDGHKIWELKPQGRTQVRLFLGLGPDGYRIIRVFDDVKNSHNSQHRIIANCADEWNALETRLKLHQAK